MQPGETAGDYRHLADFEANMRALATAYPDKARLLELPHKTLEGRTVYGLEIATNVDRNDGRAVFYIDGVHHAREWPAAEVPIMWAYDLLENYDKDDRIKAIVDNVRNIIVPVVNPDGFHYSREFPLDDGTATNAALGSGATGVVLGGQGQYVRKNRRPLLSSNLGPGLVAETAKPTNADAIGVDPNRNYAYSWGDDQAGSSADQFSQTYRGTDPLSEAESKNVSEILRTNHATAMITNHTSGNLVLWAWGDTYDDALDNDLLEGLGRAMAIYNGYRPQKGIQLYVTTGTTSDYAYGVFGSIGYTFEHAGSSFHPPYATTVPSMYEKNREAIILLATEICIAPEQRPANPQPPNVQGKLEEWGYQGGLNHGIIKGRAVDASGNGVPAVVKIYKTFDTLLWKEGNGRNPLGQNHIKEYIATSMETGPDGRFEYHVNPSTRPFVAEAGELETYDVEVLGKNSGAGISRSLLVNRGDVIDLGTVVVA